MTGPAPLPPRWAWSNLTVREAEDLDAKLDDWVGDYNRHLAVKMEHLVPACWRQHPCLAQELPVQFHGWAYIHRNGEASALEALDYYTKTLPSFRERVGDLLAPDASKCRMGRHPDRGLVFMEAIDRAATDTVAQGPNIIDILGKTTFGT